MPPSVPRLGIANCATGSSRSVPIRRRVPRTSSRRSLLARSPSGSAWPLCRPQRRIERFGRAKTNRRTLERSTMNWHLFSAFLVITVILILTPGPIVTLVIATGASKGVRAALVTVAGTSIGNAVLLAAIALGLGWVLNNAVQLFEAL